MQIRWSGCVREMTRSNRAVFKQIRHLSDTLRNGKHEIFRVTSKDYTIKPLPMGFLDGNDFVEEQKDFYCTGLPVISAFRSAIDSQGLRR
jgi:hypothetical protein